MNNSGELKEIALILAEATHLTNIAAYNVRIELQELTRDSALSGWGWRMTASDADILYRAASGAVSGNSEPKVYYLSNGVLRVEVENNKS